MNDQQAVREVLSPLYRSEFWIRFLGIVMFAQGLFFIMTLVGVVVAWLPIWIGVLLFQTVARLKAAESTGDVTAITEAYDKIGRYFVICGIYTLITTFLAFALFMSGMMFGLAQLGDKL